MTYSVIHRVHWIVITVGQGGADDKTSLYTGGDLFLPTDCHGESDTILGLDSGQKLQQFNTIKMELILYKKWPVWLAGKGFMKFSLFEITRYCQSVRV